jgi:hypothetical protein
MQSKLEANE